MNGLKNLGLINQLIHLLIITFGLYHSFWDMHVVV